MQYFLNVLHIINSDSFYLFAIPGAENDEQKILPENTQSQNIIIKIKITFLENMEIF